jgi:hypothetical protein
MNCFVSRVAGSKPQKHRKSRNFIEHWASHGLDTGMAWHVHAFMGGA